MRALVEDDIIIRVSETGNTEIGRMIKGVGHDRLRFDGTKVVDLAKLSTIHVRHKNNRFTLHCKDLGDTQPVAMSFKDRKRLINDNGTIRLKTQNEVDDEAAKTQARRERLSEARDELDLTILNNVSFSQIETYIDNNVNSLADAKTFLKRLSKLVVAIGRLTNKLEREE